MIKTEGQVVQLAEIKRQMAERKWIAMYVATYGWARKC